MPKTHCTQGHEMTPENTISEGKYTRCLACRRATRRKHYSKNRERILAYGTTRYHSDADRFRASNTAYYQANQERIRARQRDRTYGLAPGEYDALLAQQNNLCAICYKPFNGAASSSLAPVVDHCHTTGKVRGVLHSNCNRAIGLLAEDQLALVNAAHYLMRHAG